MINILTFALGLQVMYFPSQFTPQPFSLIYSWLPGSSLLHGLSLVAASGSYFLPAVCRLLIAVASSVAEHRLWGVQASVVPAPGLQGTGSVVVVRRLSCSKACGIFLDQGSNLCLLPWQADSLPQSHQESPTL